MGERLNKVIAAGGLCSRRQADVYITTGRVKVNGAKITQLGTRVNPEDLVLVDDKPLKAASLVTYALYKPAGVVTSSSHQGKDKIVTELVPQDPTVYPIGRLDKASEGLLLLSNDGHLTERLTHPRFEHPKVYAVTGKNKDNLSIEQIKARLLKGVKLGDGMAKADQVELTENKAAILGLVITVHEGRHHLIRRMCATVGIEVKQLVRTQISNLPLGNLKPGEWRQLKEEDLKLLQ